MIYFLDIYPKNMYLHGKRQNETLPFLDDFGKIMTVFNWTEGEPKSNLGTFYIKTASRYTTSMNTAKGLWKRRFICFIM